MKCALLLLCAITVPYGPNLGAGQENVPYTELVLHGDAIAAQIQTSLAGTKGELHADKVDAVGTRHPGCFVQLGPSLGDRRFEFSVPDSVVDLGYAGQIVYKVNDIRLETVGIAASTSEFILSANFMSKGVALKGAHSSLGGAVVPGIILDHMRLVIHLKPVVTTDGKISYDEPRVKFTSDVDNTFIPSFRVMGYTVDVVDAITHYHRDLCASIERQIQRALEDPTRKAALAQKIQDGISGQIAGTTAALVSLRFQGTDLVVRLRK
jgi:hypothetical protein